MEKWILSLLEWIIRSPRRTMSMVIFYKPFLYCDIKSALKLSKNDRVDELKELIEKKLLVCKTPLLKKGRLYGLTIYGRRMRRMLIDFLDEDKKKGLVEKLNIKEIKNDYKEPKEINWDVYAKIDVSKRQLRPLLEALDIHKNGVRQISSRFRENAGKSLSTGNLNGFLKRLVIMGLASYERNGMNVFYSITQEGIAIIKQLNA